MSESTLIDPTTSTPPDKPPTPFIKKRQLSTPHERGYCRLGERKQLSEQQDIKESDPSDPPLQDISGLYTEISEPLSPKLTLSFANSLCFRLRLLFIVFDLDTIIGVQLGHPTYLTFLPDMACAKKNGIDTDAYLDAIEDVLQDWLLQVIVTLFSEASYLLDEDQDEAAVLATLCPWYDHLKTSAIQATDLNDVRWLSWADPSVIWSNRRAARAARKEQAKAAGKDYRPDQNSGATDQPQRMDDYKNLAIQTAKAAALRQIERQAAPAADALPTRSTRSS